MRAQNRERLLGLGCVLVFLFVMVINPYPAQVIRDKTFDFLHRTMPRIAMPAEQSPVVIADIDEKSLARYGQWPWPRRLVGDVVRRLTDMGARVIALDVVFAERERAAAGGEASDDSFVRAVRDGPVIVSRFALDKLTPGAIAPHPSQAVVRLESESFRNRLAKMEGMVSNLREIEQAAKGIGMAALFAGADGINRWMPLVISDGRDLYPVLAVEAVRLAVGSEQIVVVGGENGIRRISFGKGKSVRVDGNGSLWLHFIERFEDRYLSIVDIMDGHIPPDRIRGRIVFVGTSASGLSDIRLGPLGAFVPGVELHAQAAESMLEGRYLNRPTYAAGAELLLLVLGGLALVIVLPLVPTLWSLPVLVGAEAATFFVGWIAFFRGKLLVDVSLTMVALIFIFLLMQYARSIFRGKEGT